VNESPQVREAGDGALLLQLERVIDPEVNARVVAIADVIRQLRLNGVRDVVSTFHSVAVYFDPLLADVEGVSDALKNAASAAPVIAQGRRHRIPVAYGGEYGPDLDDVAAHAGLTPAQVIERHCSADYRVFMLGFQPGFAYMGLVDPAIATPRRASPRLSVPAGSVGIAGRQTGVYAAASPGGWRIIGRALEHVFDYAASPPARFAPGDTVAFFPAQPDSTTRRETIAATAPDHAQPCLTVVQAGLFTTVQGAGAWGQQGSGIPVSGAMDALSHAIANQAVGNNRSAGALEMTIAGPELRVERETTIAVTGADLSATLDGSPIPLQEPVACRTGGVLRFGGRVSGARGYLAVAGGLKIDGHFPVRPVTAGQTLELDATQAGSSRAMSTPLPLPSGGARLRVMPGPQLDQLASRCLETLCASRFTVSPRSNRIGYRLTGPALPSGAAEMISDATFPGAIQVPPSGEPILLMADRQTTGGYPQVAIVITADLRMAGQLAPGDWIEFVPCSREEARAALLAQQRLLDAP